VTAANDLKQIGLALHNYHDTYGRFPPAAIYSKNGQPLLSWRVAILPFIEQDHLYREFHLDESWDSDHNRTLLARMPKTYESLGDAETEPNRTFFQVFVGKGTVFEGTKGIKFGEITDGVSNTLLVIEAGVSVPWTKPADISFDTNQPLPPLGGMFKERFRFSSLSFEGSKDILSVLADGSIHRIKKTIAEENLKKMIIRNDGQAAVGEEMSPKENRMQIYSDATKKYSPKETYSLSEVKSLYSQAAGKMAQEMDLSDRDKADVLILLDAKNHIHFRPFLTDDWVPIDRPTDLATKLEENYCRDSTFMQVFVVLDPKSDPESAGKIVKLILEVKYAELTLMFGRRVAAEREKSKK
jgi:hypothetical protein